MAVQLKSKQAAVSTAVRCAIYTRKSTSEGLDQAFNSLDAQRESAEAYIASQRHEGWMVVPDHYDDGGYTGGNMDRPAFQRLMADIENGKIDVCMVYKVDRLSRSLMDFARIIQVFEKHNVSFVSVTQQFNTGTSMGRLMLNVLLSFAQFEREMISERTRDKMGAARRKGKWLGGRPPLGYDVDRQTHKLVVNRAEADQVREIFALYIRRRALIPVVEELNRRGWTSKTYIKKNGEVRPGQPFTKTMVYNILKNPTYIGKAAYNGQIYQGEHDAVIPADTFDDARKIMRENSMNGGAHVRNKYGGLLKGLVRCRNCGTAMFHTYTKKGQKMYRYYVCAGAQKKGWDSCPSKSVPAAEIEKFVVEQIKGIGRDPGVLESTLRHLDAERAEREPGLKSESQTLRKQLLRLESDVNEILEASGGGGPEEAVADRLADLQDQIRARGTRLAEVRRELEGLAVASVDRTEVARALEAFDPVWDALFPREQARILQLLIAGIEYDGSDGTLAITFNPAGIKELAGLRDETQKKG